jgi:hypothetical protein
MARPSRLTAAAVGAALIVAARGTSPAVGRPLPDHPQSSCLATAVAAGDLAEPVAAIVATGQRAVALKPDRVLLLGDNQYPSGSLSDYRTVFAATPWATLLPAIRPVPGNHEYRTPGAAGYYSYFGVRHYYAFSAGCGWRAYALNSEESLAPQVQWIRQDLAAHPNARVLAYWHQPVWSSGEHGNNPAMVPLIDAFQGRLEIVLWGHDHDYERGVSGSLDWFVVGTGGSTTRTLAAQRVTGSKVAIAGIPGVLHLMLRPTGWTATFVDVTGKVLDSASG